MRICSICGRISGSGQDHLDCTERRRVELEDEDFKGKIPDKLDVSGGSELAKEVRAIMEHMARDRERQS